MIFNFTKAPGSGNNYILDLDITNTTPTPGRPALPTTGNPNGNLVGFGFNVPGKDNNLDDISIVSYDSLGSVFVKDLRDANFAPFGDFSFCSRNSGNNCVGGQADGNGLIDGESAKVRFNLASNVASVDTAEEVASVFYKLFGTWNPESQPNSPQVALRFQQVDYVTKDGKVIIGSSDKVGGTPQPPRSPNDTVPGPVPILGAASAFAFSRRLRRRISATQDSTHPAT